MDIMTDTINREALGKGIYFQKNRAVIRILDHIKNFGEEPVFCAIEFIEDSLLIHDSPVGSIYELEENKNYSSSFSFNSDPIKNTLVAFVDQYHKFLNDDQCLKFSIYCCAKLGDEKLKSNFLSPLNIKLDDGKNEKKYSILKKIIKNELLNSEETTIAKNLFLDEYKKQYTEKDQSGAITGYSGYFNQIKSWCDDKFLDFLSKIEWVFDDSNMYLDDIAINAIKNCHQFYSISDHKGKESIILNECKGLLEKRQFSSSLMGRFINSADIENIFLKIGSNIEKDKPVDPSWKAFATLKAEDTRNLSDKYNAVSDVVTIEELRRLSRLATNSKLITGSEFGKEYVSLRYQVFEIGDKLLRKLSLKTKHCTEEELDKIIEQIVDITEQKLIDWKKTYKISINDRTSIEGIVLSLFDDCFLAFDEIEQVNLNG